MKKVLLYLMLFLLPMYAQNNMDQYLQKKQRQFARELMSEREYYRAITEFYRLNSYFPNHRKQINNLHNIARCYHLAHHHLEAIQVHKKILTLDTLNWCSISSIARLYQQINYFYESNQHIALYQKRLRDAPKDTLQILTALNYLNLQNFPRAREILSEIKPTSILYDKAALFKSKLANELPLKTKHRHKAILFGIVLPGSGYFYTGRYQTAIAAFAVNSLFGLITYDNFKQGRTSLGIFTGFFSSGFYLGSLYGSIQSVDKYNTNVTLKFIKTFNL